MNKERIAELLQEPARVAREDLAGLRELRERYPWFSGAHLLLAIGENASGDVLFDGTLRTTAAHVPSRQVLHELAVADPVPAHDPGPVEIMPSVAIPVVRLPDEPPGTSIGRTRDELADRLLRQQIAEAAAAGVYDLEASVERSTLTDQQAPLPVRTANVIDTERPAPTATQPTTRSFTSWLEAESRAPAHTSLAVPQRHLPTSIPVGAAERSVSAEQTRSVIDRFLKQETPEPKKAAFFSPQEAGKRSLEERLDIVTETLARIHEKQGHWAKAAQAYRRLALKHPEKSGYFAALAKKAEENLNV